MHSQSTRQPQRGNGCLPNRRPQETKQSSCGICTLKRSTQMMSRAPQQSSCGICYLNGSTPWFGGAQRPTALRYAGPRPRAHPKTDEDGADGNDTNSLLHPPQEGTSTTDATDADATNDGTAASSHERDDADEDVPYFFFFFGHPV